MNLEKLIDVLPKAELHLHIEGSLEPELMMKLAKKHQTDLPYSSIEEVKAAYQFDDLQSFLDLYYLGASVLVEEDDFFELMWQYLCKCKAQNIVHTEIMFDPQTHTRRGVGFEVFMPGFIAAMDKAKAQWGQSSQLIMCFLRHLSEEQAIATLEQAKPYWLHITAVGLDSSEVGNPPSKFQRVFAKAHEAGFKCVAHAGEEGPPEYIHEAIDLLHIDRIDHGVRSIEDSALMVQLKETGMPLTVCPLSNTKLRVFDKMSDHNILDLLDAGLLVTVNSDDPSYFGGYLNENFHALNTALDLSPSHLKRLVLNSFEASFIPEAQKQRWCEEVEKLFEQS